MGESADEQDGFPIWLRWTLLTLVLWGIWAVLSKGIPPDGPDALSPAQIQTVSTLGILPVLALLFLTREPRDPRRSPAYGFYLAFCGGLISALGNLPYYDLLNHSKVSSIVPLTSLYPLVTVLLAVGFLRERLNGLQRIGIPVSLLAIYLLNVREEGPLAWDSLLLALAPVVSWGVAGLLQKVATNHAPPVGCACWFLLAFVPVGLVMKSADPPPSVQKDVFLIAVCIGFTMALGNYTILRAFAMGGKASVIAPLGSLYPLVSIPLAIYYWHERVTGREAAGIVCALLSVVLLAWETNGSSVPSGAAADG